MVENKQEFNVWKLVVVLCSVVVVVGVGIWIGIALTHRNVQDSNASGEIDIGYAMEGWEGGVADSTKAMILTENINYKLNSDSGYSVSDAISDYENVYNNTGGELKVYVAIEYADYVYDNTRDLGLAVSILENVQGLASGHFSEKNLLDAICGLYVQAGDKDKVEYYKTIISDKYPSGQMIDIKRSSQDE